MKLDGYHDFKHIGAGPLGPVYKAIQDDTNGVVRLKLIMINDQFNSEQKNSLKDIFFRRCILLRKLQKLGIIGHINAGRTDHFLFLVNDYLDARPLLEHLSDRPRQTRENILNIMTSVAKVLDTYHDNDLLHNNIKISNVIFDEDRSFLLDGAVSSYYQFLIDHDINDLRDFRYLSPEIMNDEPPKAVDDIFSLSVLFYRCLVGRYPFSEQTNLLDVATSYEPPTRLRPELNPAFDSFFERAFETDQKTRIPDVQTFLNDLQQLQNQGLYNPDILTEEDDEEGKKMDSETENEVEDLLKEAIPTKRRAPVFIILGGFFLLLIFIGLFFLSPQLQQIFLKKQTEDTSPPIVISETESQPVTTVEKTAVSTAPKTTDREIAITSEPDGLNIFHLKKFVGTTPFNFPDLDPGDYDFIFHKVGYQSRIEKVSWRPGAAKQVFIETKINSFHYPISPDKGWQTFGRDPLHSNFTNEKISIPPEIKWKVPVAKELYSSPAIWQNEIYLTSPAKYLTVYDLENGNVIRSVEQQIGAVSTAAVTDKFIFISGKDGTVRAFDHKKMKSKAEETTQSSILSSPVISHDRLYTVTAVGTVVALDIIPKRFKKLKFQRRWAQDINERVSASPVIFEDKLVLINSERNLYAFDCESGTLLWHYLSQDSSTSGNRATISDTKMRLAEDDALNASPCICGETVVYATIEGWIYGLNVKNGDEQWKLQTGNSIFATAACYKGMTFIGSKDGRVYAVDAVNGSLLFVIEIGVPIYSAAIVADETLLFGADNGKIYLYNPHNGLKLGELELSGKLRASPAIASGTIIFVSDDGFMYALK
ncbi:PQQ-binding-like beta-propeller repeat protein [candidate division CSSED10-310 bacterium]|uniref:PQQ-binding-like beta-propeller repeat protein n=1 Tax=candidate division CSSED10-310 bacterium TaxID=2855610 RepID=A0ABV6YVG7_UNCC1